MCRVKYCVTAPSFCDLHSATRTRDLSRVKLILSQGRADINCKEWIGRTPVMFAAGKGNIELVELLVRKGANVSLVDRFDNNILHSACLGGHVEVVKYVLSQDIVNINSRVWCGRTPVMLAAENGHRVVVELLVNVGADVTLVDKKGDNLLHFASWGGNVEVVKFVLSLGMLSINSRGWQEITPVMLAVDKGHNDVVELLVSKGADVSFLDKGHGTLLHFACRGGNVEVVKFVLSLGMLSINSRGWKKMTPVMTAADKGHKEVVELLVSKGADVSLLDKGHDTLLHLACKGGNVEVVKFVLSLGMLSINSRGWQEMTPVMLAADKGHKEVVELLVSKGADVSLLDKGHDTLLHLACKGGNVEVVKFVLSLGMQSINSRGWQEMTPVMLAADKGHKEVVELLVSKGADVSLLDKGHDTLLHLACKGGNVEVVKFVLSLGMQSINSRGWQEMTPVMLAADKGHKEVVELLVSKGADVSLLDKGHGTLLHLACKGGNVEVVKFVLSLGMLSINSRGWQEMTPVMLAADKGHKEVVELLVSKGADVSLLDKGHGTLLHFACRGGNVEVVKFVLSLGMLSINSRGWKKMTPVMLAANKGHKEVVELLVSKGADVSLLDKGHDTLLHLACKGGNVEVVKFVLSLGMQSINSRGWKKMTPVMLAADKGHKEVVELLVSKGADVSLLDKGHDTLLHFACRGGNVEVVKFVLSLGMLSINSRGWKKMTPVMLAANKGHKEVVELLVSKGADVSLLDKGHDTLLHLACKGGNVEVVKFVLSLGMQSINSRGWKKMTPVMLAADKGHKEVVELLVSKGADVSLLDKGHDTLLHLACKGGNVEVVKFVLSLGMLSINSRGWKKMTPVMLAANKGHKEVVELLVSKGADVSLLDKGHDTLLHLACKGGNVGVVKFVLSLGMLSINSRGWKKMTPVMLAANKGHKEVVELLVSKGADVSLLDKGHDTLLHLACKGGNVEVVKFVLSLGMQSINSRGWQEMTPVMLAADKGYKEVVELLVSKGADVSLLDKGHDTLLHLACKGGNVEVVKFVLSLGMLSINSRGWQEMTPVMLAADKGHKEVVELLVSKGADVSLLDKGHDTLLHFACRGGNVEVVKFLLSLDMVDINARNSKSQTAANIATSRGRRDIIDLLMSHGGQMY
ncbi:ankyrin repeat domain-containing protein 17-like [Haliotis rufescens]|uniref:ankyrin repeat domain-containing protein 17-like n=1 Tax=Haliotis rufescens TaxID=6454 RepID=UPI00201F5B46|nr:ankyrin repeat domain-containing protein 17-like [Haliotis rufescens]